jgi:hypothetical protein
MGFCHHCKQFKTTYMMANCNYQSQVHGLMLPISYTANGISCPNVEPQNTEILNHMIMRMVYFDKKKLRSLEDAVEFSCKK